MDSKELLSYFLPEGILEYFEITEVKESNDRLVLVLEEKPLPAVEQSQKRLHSQGFYPTVQIQDFPIRRKACCLEVKRRRWINTDPILERCTMHESVTIKQIKLIAN